MNKPNTIKVFYHPASALDKIQEAFGDRYFFLGKPKAVLEALQGKRLNFEHHIPQPFTWEDFELCHAPEYIEAVKTGAPRELAESCAISWSKEFAETLPYMTSCNFFQSGVFPCKSNGFVLFL